MNKYLDINEWSTLHMIDSGKLAEKMLASKRLNNNKS